MLGDIYSMPINGGDAKRITKGMAYDSHPRFSPDGNSIVYTSDKSGNVNVWTRDLETNDSLQITKGKDNQTAFADWSKDGDYIIASTRSFTNTLSSGKVYSSSINHPAFLLLVLDSTSIFGVK